MSEISPQRRNDLICLCLALATAAVYWPVRHFQFVNYDDVSYVSQNPYVKGGLTLKGLGWAFTSYYKSNWHPLTWLSHMVDCQLFGLDAGAHHLVNLLFHIATVLLLFHVLNRMTLAPWRSAFVAALFALHPLHVESVAWVAERKDVLSAFFWILTMWAYIRYVEQPSDARFSLSVGLYALGLMAKPMVVTLPFVLLLLDYWPLGRTRCTKSAVVVGEKANARLSQLLREKLPFLPLTIMSCIVTFRAQHSTGVIASLERMSIGDRVANAMVAYVRYLGKAFWPGGLAAFYPYQKWPLGVVVAAATVLLGVSAWVIWKARCKPQFIVGWLLYLGTLVPVIGLVQVGDQSMADRYTYLPLIGVFIMVAWAVPRNVFEQRARRQAAAATAAVLLGMCAVLCRAQLFYWKNSETLFRHALDVTTNNWVAHCNLGAALVQTGRLQEALGHFERQVALKPDDAEGHCSLGNVLLVLGRAPEAEAQFEQAVRLKPDFAEAHNNMGAALLEAGKTKDAIRHYEQAVQIAPDSTEFQNNLAWALATLAPAEGGDPGRAVSLAQRVCERTGNRVATYLDTLAAANAASGRFDDAIATAQKAVQLARSAAQPQLVREIETRLQLYRDGRAYRPSLR